MSIRGDDLPRRTGAVGREAEVSAIRVPGGDHAKAMAPLGAARLARAVRHCLRGIAGSGAPEGFTPSRPPAEYLCRYEAQF